MNHWIIPYKPYMNKMGNGKIASFDVTKAFRSSDKIDLYQPINSVAPGDEVYIYASKPIGKVLFKTRVLETNRPSSDPAYDHFFLVELVKDFSDRELTYDILREHGLNGPILTMRRVREELLDFLDNQ